MQMTPMRCFYYRILLENGCTRRGLFKLAIVQTSSAQVYLEQRWMAVVLSLTPLPRWFNPLFDAYHMVMRRNVSHADLTDFFRNLAVMLGGGVPIMEAMEELTADNLETPITALAYDLQEHLRSGVSLSDSLEEHVDVVPETVRNLVRIGETSGTLDITLAHAADHLGRVVRITQDSKRALIYPAFVFAAILGATMFWIYYVVPNISDLFRQMRVDLPWLTVSVVAFAAYVHEHFLLFISIPVVVFGGSALLVRHNQYARFIMHKLVYHAPVARVLVRSSSLAFITEYLSLLLAAGVDVAQSLDVLQRSISNEVYRRKMSEVRNGVMRGNSLSEAMRTAGVFPGFMLRMIGVGEQTGTLDHQLSYLAEEYRHRFEHVVASIGEIIQPVVMLVAGGLFILMVSALFLPIYQLIGQVGALR